MKKYPTDLSDSQWQIINNFLHFNRRRKSDLRQILNGILYLVKTGCQWRMLPRCYPCWQTVYYYFQVWKHKGLIEKIQLELVKLIRIKRGRKAHVSVGIIDAQSVKSTLVSSRKTTGYDGGKKIKGIKRHIVVDTMGSLLCVVVHAASMADRKGAYMVLEKLRQQWSGIVKIFADGGYPLPGRAGERLQTLCGYVMEIIKRTDLNNFKVIPKRWIVERTFAWIETNRRNAKSYERSPKSAEVITQLSAIRIMINHF